MTLMLTHNCVLSRTHKHTHTHTLTHYTKEADEASKPLMLQNIFTLPRAQCCVHGHEWRDLASFESQEGGGLHVCVWGGSTEHAGKFNELEVDPSEVCNVAERFHAGTAAATALSPLRLISQTGLLLLFSGGSSCDSFTQVEDTDLQRLGQSWGAAILHLLVFLMDLLTCVQ